MAILIGIVNVINIRTLLLFILVYQLMYDTAHSSHAETQHKTKAASEKQHDLWCYRCDNSVHGARCLDLQGNNQTDLHSKCTKEQKKCQVQRISMSKSTDEITGKPQLWLLLRNCSESCEPGCIVIGERTKLHSCITCCDEHNFCNSGSTGSRLVPIFGRKVFTAIFVHFLAIFLYTDILISNYKLA